MTNKPAEQDGAWDHSSHDEFYRYYASESLNEATLDRFRRQRDLVLQVSAIRHRSPPFDVVDIGCGAGTMAMIWAESGNSVIGLDVNEPLIELAGKRADESGLDVRFEVGTATGVPWDDGSADIYLMPELLEHVADWQSCLDEAARILRPGGILLLSTSNKLCPVQQEFNLPLYSWYPGPLKRHFERLATTSRPSIANYAKYPAVNWFTFYGLRAALATRGFDDFLDRFDLASTRDNGTLKNAILKLIRVVPPLRWMGHVATPGTTLVAIKRDTGS